MDPEGDPTDVRGEVFTICCGQILSDYITLVRRNGLKVLLIITFMINDINEILPQHVFKKFK